MKTVPICQGQTPNACGFISLRVFQALTQIHSLDQLKAVLTAAHTAGLNDYEKYRKEGTDKDVGEGIVVEEFFEKNFIKSNKLLLINPQFAKNSKELVEDFIDHRRAWEGDRDLWELFDGTIAAVADRMSDAVKNKLIREGKKILDFLWGVKQEDLLGLMTESTYNAQLSFNTLKPDEGYIFTKDGHTLSMVYKVINSQHYYFYYNSNTGCLYHTNDIKEAERFIMEHSQGQIQAFQCRSTLTVVTNPKPSKEEIVDTIIQPSPVASDKALHKKEETKPKLPQPTPVVKEPVAVKTAITAEQINDFINNRQHFDSIDDWLQVNFDLVLQITTLNPDLILELPNINDPKVLCALLEIEYKSVKHPHPQPVLVPPVQQTHKKEELTSQAKPKPESTPLTKEPVAVKTAITAEQINDFINNRQHFDSIDDWLQVNVDLVLQITILNPGLVSVLSTIKDPQLLCALLGIEYKSLKNPNNTQPVSMPPIQQAHTKEEYKSQPPSSKPNFTPAAKDPVAVKPEITAEQIKNLIKNRKLVKSIEQWIQLNSDLVTQIITINHDLALVLPSIKDPQILCELLGIEFKADVTAQHRTNTTDIHTHKEPLAPVQSVKPIQRVVETSDIPRKNDPVQSKMGTHESKSEISDKIIPVVTEQSTMKKNKDNVPDSLDVATDKKPVVIMNSHQTKEIKDPGYRREKVKKINIHLTMLEAKIDALAKDGYQTASDEAKKIHKEITKKVTEYERGVINEPELITSAQSIIANNRAELDQFRGWKLKKVGEVLVNLLIAIGTVGMLYATTGQFTIFQVKTDSANVVDNLDDSVKNQPS